VHLKPADQVPTNNQNDDIQPVASRFAPRKSSNYGMVERMLGRLKPRIIHSVRSGGVISRISYFHPVEMPRLTMVSAGRSAFPTARILSTQIHHDARLLSIRVASFSDNSDLPLVLIRSSVEFHASISVTHESRVASSVLKQNLKLLCHTQRPENQNKTRQNKTSTRNCLTKKQNRKIHKSCDCGSLSPQSNAKIVRSSQWTRIQWFRVELKRRNSNPETCNGGKAMKRSTENLLQKWNRQVRTSN
jgi:hypothetical protein